MRQFTNSEQTRKLKELGFPAPKSVSDHEYDTEMGRTTILKNYSIGELLEFMDSAITEPDEEVLVWKDTIFWYVKFAKWEDFFDTELINALYDYCVALKTEGII